MTRIKKIGIPEGGEEGQVLTKNSSTDYDTSWGSGGGGGSTAWADITGKPAAVTSLSGTNTGDNATNTQYSGLAASKQDALVSGTNIKTINGSSVLGSGNLVISGGVSDGDKGDITVSASGATWTIDNSVVTYAKIQNVSPRTLLGNSSVGATQIEQISIGSGLSLTAGVLSTSGVLAQFQARRIIRR